jgi:hypothetical protein
MFMRAPQVGKTAKQPFHVVDPCQAIRTPQIGNGCPWLAPVPGVQNATQRVQRSRAAARLHILNGGRRAYHCQSEQIDRERSGESPKGWKGSDRQRPKRHLLATRRAIPGTHARLIAAWLA